MLKTNSKQAKENIRKFIIDNFTPENYTNEPPTEFVDIAKFILDVFHSEKWNCKENYQYYGSESNAFHDWCSGLCDLIGGEWYYKYSAIDMLGEILEETDAEKAKYTEAEAEKMIDYLIFRELQAANK